MIHKNKNNWVESKRNPFLGEEWVVFENGDGAENQASTDNQQQTPETQQVPQADVDRWLAPNYERASQSEDALIRDIKEIVPGERPYTPEQKSEIERTWGDMMKEYNGVQSYVDHFTKLRNHVLSDEFDPKEERWRAHGLGKLYKSFEAIESVKGLKLSSATKRRLRKKQAEEVNASKNEIARDIADIIAGLERAREQMLQAIEEQMRRDFSARLKYLDKQVADNPPPHFSEADVLETRKRIREVRGKVNHDLPHFFEDNDEHATRIREYGKINEDIDGIERSLADSHQDGHEMVNIEIGDLQGEYDTLVKLKKEKIDPIASAYAAKIDQRVSELNGLLFEIANTDMYDSDHEQDRQDDMKGIRKTIANLQRSRNIGKIMDDTLDNNEPMRKQTRDENGELVKGEPIVIKFDDGSEHHPKEGIKQQLAFIDDPRLNGEQRRMFAVGLREAMEMFKKDVNNTVSYFENDLDVISEKVKIQRDAMNAPEPERKQFKIMWFAAYDVVRAFEIVKEWSKRRYQRAATNRVGQFGSDLLSPLGSKYNPISPLKTLPNEFDKEVERAEQEEVNQYKEIYANKDMWQVEDVAWNTQNKDEFKACLYLLAENGRLRWDTDEMLAQIMRFQDQVTFGSAQSEIQDISRFYEKLKTAVGFMWDYDTFNAMKNQNSSAYDSKKQEYEQNCHEWAESAGALTKVIKGMLRAHKERGREAKVDPILYEKIIEYAIHYGKMGPEEKLYYLIQGMAIGLLAPDRGSVLNSTKINDYPSIDWFGSKTARGPKPTLEDIQEVAQYDYDAFTDWFHREAMTKAGVTQRIDKTLTQGNKLDHDDLTAFLGYMSEATTESVLQKHADGFRLPQTGVQNGTVSMVFYLDNMAENYNRMSNSNEALVRFIGSFSRYDAITMNRMYRAQGGNYFRWDTSTYNDSPRSAESYKDMYGRGSSMTARKNMEKVRGFLKVLDPKFFGALYDYRKSEMSNEQAASIANEVVKRYGTDAVFEGDVPKTVDELYQSIGKFARYIIEHHPEKIREMLETVKADHASTYKDYKKHIEKGDQAVQRLRETRRREAPVRPAEGNKWTIPESDASIGSTFGM